MRWCRRFSSATLTSSGIIRGWSSAAYSACITRLTNSFPWWVAPIKSCLNSSNRRKPSSPSTTRMIVASATRSSQLSLLSLAQRILIVETSTSTSFINSDSTTSHSRSQSRRSRQARKSAVSLSMSSPSRTSKGRLGIHSSSRRTATRRSLISSSGTITTRGLKTSGPSWQTSHTTARCNGAAGVWATSIPLRYSRHISYTAVVSTRVVMFFSLPTHLEK